jgi:2-oxoglutarate dehydrogenase E1 component
MPGSNLSESYSIEFLEREYQAFQRNPKSVEPSLYWMFMGMELYGPDGRPGQLPGDGHLVSQALSNGNTSGNGHANGKPIPLSSLNVESRIQTAAVRLINSYRLSGHLIARSNPLVDQPAEIPFELDPKRFAVNDGELDLAVDGSMMFGTEGKITLRELITALQETYCGSVGFEFMHVQNFDARSWLAHQMEPSHFRFHPKPAERIRTLTLLRRAEIFENFLQTKFLGKKRFGLEGGETLVPMMDAIVRTGANLGVLEIVIGMPHRGRLNVLTNVLKMPCDQLFVQFLDPYHPDAVENDGDVKYHLGRSDDVTTPNGKTVHLTLTPNPSHLEAVNPVVEGRVRCKQRLHNDTERKNGLPLLLHGDAAFAGQGLVSETLSMANLKGYRTGGTIHIVVNNQIGFTTHPRDARSTQYCTDLAKFIHAPIFHVNAEDPDACVRIAELATEYRQKFASDVVIDLMCYRKMGHNENDDATMTQPVEYRKIADKYRNQQSTIPLYTERLLQDGTVTRAEVEQIDTDYKDGILEVALRQAKEDGAPAVTAGHPLQPIMPSFGSRWVGLKPRYVHTPAATAVRGEVLDRIADALVAIPAGFILHKNLQAKSAEGRYPSNDSPYRRRDLIKARESIDWGTGEALAFGSLVLEGHPVRLSGQDSRRATFSFRHAYYYDAETGAEFCPLANLGPDAAPFDVFDSFLSEAAVLGFEYGYSLDDPNSLVLWEAQFGDFVNGAQVMIDQFIASGESKWNRSSGLVLLLPHGYEGQGPEHSSARPERFLQLCAEDNLQVCTFTTPAQYFHALRRQVKRNFRKPLVVMTPKSFLRTSTSPLEDFISGRFHEVIDDATVTDRKAIKRVLLCTGKVFFDLKDAREKAQRTDVAIVRIEQLYPWPEQQLREILLRYPSAERIWVQEESENNGAWSFVEPRLWRKGLGAEYCGRDASASPAVGSEKMHKHEQAELMDAALNKPMPYRVE